MMTGRVRSCCTREVTNREGAMRQKRGTIPEILADDRERERERGITIGIRGEGREKRNRKAPHEIKGPEFQGGTPVSLFVWLLAQAVNSAFNVKL